MGETCSDQSESVHQSEDDETAYLLKSEANRKHLLAALADVEAGRNLVAVKPEELAAMK